MVTPRKVPTSDFTWNAENIRALRGHLGVTQTDLADVLGMRQQTVSEWETGMYKPRGASVTVLTLVGLNTRFDFERNS